MFRTGATGWRFVPETSEAGVYTGSEGVVRTGHQVAYQTSEARLFRPETIRSLSEKRRAVHTEYQPESLYRLSDVPPGEIVTLERTVRKLHPIDISKLDPTKVSEPEEYRGMFDVLRKTEQIEVDRHTAEEILGGTHRRPLTIYGADLPTGLWRKPGEAYRGTMFTFLPSGQHAPDVDVATEILRRSTLDPSVKASMAAATTLRDVQVERLINKYELTRKRPIMINAFNASERGALQRIVDMMGRGEVEKLPIVAVGDPMLHKEALANAHSMGGTFVQAADPTDAYDIMEGLVHPSQQRFLQQFKRDRFGRQMAGMFTAKGDYIHLMRQPGMLIGAPQTGSYLGSTLTRHYVGGEFPHGTAWGGATPAKMVQLPLSPTELKLGDVPVSAAFGKGVRFTEEADAWQYFLGRPIGYERQGEDILLASLSGLQKNVNHKSTARITGVEQLAATETGVPIAVHTDVEGVILRGEIPHERIRTLMDGVDLMAEAIARKRRIRMGAKMAQARRIEANRLLLGRWTEHYGTEEVRRRMRLVQRQLIEEAPERLRGIRGAGMDYWAQLLYQQERHMGFLDIEDAATIERTGAFRIQEQRIRPLVSKRAELFGEMMPIPAPLGPEQVAEYNRLLRTEGIIKARRGMADRKALNWQMMTAEKIEDGVRVRSAHPFVAAGRFDAAVLDDVDAETLFAKIRGIPELEGLVERAEARVESAFGMYEQLPLERQIATLQRHGIIEGWQPMAYRGLIVKRMEEAQTVVASHAPELREAFREQTARNIIRELIGERPMPLIRATRGPLHAQAILRGLEPEEQLQWLTHYGIISPEQAQRAASLAEEGGIGATIQRYLPELEEQLGREGPIAGWMRYQRAAEPREGWKAWQWSVRHRLEILEAQDLMENATKNLKGAVRMFKMPEEILAAAAARPAGEHIAHLRAGLYERLGAKRAGRMWRRIEERRTGAEWRPTAAAFQEEVQEYVRGGIERGLTPYEERLRQLGRVPEGVYTPAEAEPALVQEHLFERAQQLEAEAATGEARIARFNELSSRRARRISEAYQERVSLPVTTAHPEVRRAAEEMTLDPDMLARMRAGEQIPIGQAGTKVAYAARWDDLMAPMESPGTKSAGKAYTFLRAEGLGEALRRVDIADISGLSGTHVILPGVNDRTTAERIFQSIRRYIPERRLSMEETQEIAQDAASQIVNLRERGVFHIEAGKAIIAPEHGTDIAANIEQYIRYRVNRRMQDVRRTLVTPEIAGPIPGREYLPEEVAKLIEERKFAYSPELGGALLGEMEEVGDVYGVGVERISLQALAEQELGEGLAEEVRTMFGDLRGVDEEALARQIAAAETPEDALNVLAEAGIDEMTVREMEVVQRQRYLFDEASQGFERMFQARRIPQTGYISLREPLTQVLGVPEEGPVWTAAQRTRTITPGVGTVIEAEGGARYKVVEMATFEPFASPFPPNLAEKAGDVPWVVPVGEPGAAPMPYMRPEHSFATQEVKASPELLTPGSKQKQLERTMDVGEFNLFARQNLAYRRVREETDRMLAQGDASVALSPQQIEDLLLGTKSDEARRLASYGRGEAAFQGEFTKEEIDAAIRGERERIRQLAGQLPPEKAADAVQAGLFDAEYLDREMRAMEIDPVEAEMYADRPTPSPHTMATAQLDAAMEAKATADRRAMEMLNDMLGEQRAAAAQRAGIPLRDVPTDLFPTPDEWYRQILAGEIEAPAELMDILEEVRQSEGRMAEMTAQMEARFAGTSDATQAGAYIERSMARREQAGFSAQWSRKSPPLLLAEEVGDETASVVSKAMKKTHPFSAIFGGKGWRKLLPFAGIAAAGLGIAYGLRRVTKPDEIDVPVPQVSRPEPPVMSRAQVPDARGRGTRIVMNGAAGSDMDEQQFGHSLGRVTASINNVPANVRITMRDDSTPMNDRYMRNRIREVLAA